MQSPYIVELNEQNFQETLQSSMDTPVLVHFWASMSQESVEVIPALQELAQQYSGAFTLALLNCEQQQALAAQFGVQTLPTIALFINGQATDGLGGPQTIEAISAMLTKHLPSQDERHYQLALKQCQEGLFSQSLNTLLELSEEFKAKGEVQLTLAECLIETQQFDEAETILESIPLQFKNQDFKNLIAKVELHKQAADSPELKALEQQHEADPNNAQLALDLGLQYHQANRNEEALTLMWSFLAKNLNECDGDMKKGFMDILNALGQSHPLSSTYRRQLYSLLY